MTSTVYSETPLIRQPFVLRKSGLKRGVGLIAKIRTGDLNTVFIKRFVPTYFLNL